MRISFLTETFYNNECFNSHSSSNRDNYLEHIIQLKAKFQKAGIDLSTGDINLPDNSDAIIQYGTNLNILKNTNKKKYYLIALESPIVDTGAVNPKQHKYFNKIFTWNDELVDNKKYFKVNDSHKFPSHVEKKYDGKNLCCTISGNKIPHYSNKNELYSKRVEFIRWFEKHHPEEFGLYGTDWNTYQFPDSFFGKIVNKMKIKRKKNIFTSYKGVIKSKNYIMKKYKFSICYENCKGYKGYITEKIFDSFFAGCVPIYWGADNVDAHIPKECFIDKRNFENFEDVYKFIKYMSKENYFEYLKNIELFLTSNKANQFKAKNFANVIAKEIIKDLL